MSIKSANPAVARGARQDIANASWNASSCTHSRNVALKQDAPALLAAALAYVAQGVSVFPLWPRSKEPACKHGFKNATSNPATIRRYWLAQPEFNIGIATGIVSGVWVLDVDGLDGGDTLRDLSARHRSISTLTSETARGHHLWFLTDGPIQSSAGRVGPGLDVRGDGGYVVAPPSVHPHGPVYRWLNAAPPAVAPDWLVDLTRPRPPTPSISQRAIARRSVGLPGAYARAALEREIEELANTPQGARNHALNRASFSLHQLVAGGELDGAEVRDRLIDAAIANGLMADPDDGPRAVMRTIASGARAGMRHPRTRRGAS
jgi:Bifunctional DNA primase/polymerase, N-terminal